MSGYRWERNIPEKERYDVIVAGGGIAGISAALAAARNGARTLLIEREWALGGLATLGMIAIYLPLCDGFGHQVSFGIAEELIRLSVLRDRKARAGIADWLDGSDPDRLAAGGRFETRYNPWIFSLRAERLLKQNGVTILYGSQIVGAAVTDDRIQAVYVENKSGCSAYGAVNFIDCTGDADLCEQAGAETVLFERKNTLSGWYFGVDGNGAELRILGEADVTEKMEQEGFTVQRLTQRRFSGIDGAENSEMMILSHEKTLEDIEKKQEQDPDFGPAAITVIPELRKTRRLSGVATPDSDPEAYPEDCIGVIANWRKRGPCYALPYTALFGDRIRNLAVAGRCISVTDDLWEYTRVIPACAVTGEAAGTAAAMQMDFGQVSVRDLQRKLVRQGVILNPERKRI